MALMATIVQQANNYLVEDQQPDSPVTLTNPVTKGNMLVGFQSYDFGPAPGPPPYSDSLDNAWTTVNDSSVNVSGLNNASTGCALISVAGTDTVTTPLRGLGIFFTDCNAFEVSGVTALDSFSQTKATNGTTTPISASLTLSTGDVVSFSTAGSYPNWFVTLIALRSETLLRTNFYVFACCNLQINGGLPGAIEETVPNWTFLHSDGLSVGNPSGNVGFNGIYGQAFEIERTNFQYPSGKPVANGFITVGIDQDVHTPNGGLMVPGVVNRVDLDADGNANNYIEFSNADLTPAGSSYLISVYSPEGQLIRGPYKFQIPDSWL